MKATDEQILAAVDGEMCDKQAEKLRIIHSHLDNLELCNLNLESVILSTTEKYLPQLNLILTVTDIQTFSAISIISEIGVNMSVFPPPSIYALGQVLRHKTTRAQTRKRQHVFQEQVHTSSHCLFNVLMLQLKAKNIRK